MSGSEDKWRAYVEAVLSEPPVRPAPSAEAPGLDPVSALVAVFLGFAAGALMVALCAMLG